jgi:acetyltransferase-like isoleucine patch superfamily enzyme
MAYLRGLLWSLCSIRAPTGLMLGPGVRMIGKSRLRIGRGVSIGGGSYMDLMARWGVQLSDGVTIREFCWLQCRSGLNQEAELLSIGPRTYIGPGAILGIGGPVVIGADNQIGARFTLSAESHEPGNDGSYVSGAVSRVGVTIGSRCWFGNNVSIVDGVTIGDNVVVGANSLVTHNIPANSVAFGAPARVRRTITRDGPEPGTGPSAGGSEP